MPDASPFHLTLDSFGRLVLTLPSGENHVGVVPVRAFPFSQPAGWVVFCDENGREVYCLQEPAQLTDDSRRLLEEELARREFVPQIERIADVTPGAEPTEWNVVTDRGSARFRLVSEDHIRRIGEHAALITDSHGVRYLIADLQALDAHSRRLLRRYL
ncbi:MAG: cyanophycin metabolism-associated DUF1854 family protein [Planctomycetaceae bacterium]